MNAQKNDKLMFSPEAILVASVGDEDVMKELMDIYISDTQSVIQSLATCLKENNSEKIYLIVHKVIAAANLFEMTLLYIKLIKVQDACLFGQPEEIQQSVIELIAMLKDSVNQMIEYKK